MNCTQTHALLHDYVYGVLASAEGREMDLHVAQCDSCRRALASLQGLRKATAELPREFAPRDLWGEIVQKLAVAETNASDRDDGPLPERSALRTMEEMRRGTTRRGWLPRLAFAASVTVLVSLGWWHAIRDRPAPPDWAVAALSGLPRVGDLPFQNQARLRIGQWLETDSGSSAKLEVGSIGEVRVEPNSRVRLVGSTSSDHRLELAQGTLNALIWSPPRLFFVETSAATAIDLGCAYSLTVDERGGGILRVTAGYVALEHDGHESVISAGIACATRRGIGPGTPFRMGAPAPLREALARFDFDGGKESALDQVLAAVSENDGITLWHLLARGSPSNRRRVFDVLVGFHSPPIGVTREGIVHGDETMREKWGAALGLTYAGRK